MKTFIAFVIFIGSLTPFAGADTVFLKKDSKSLKGLIVEEYADRIVLSTHEGEKTLLRSNIRSIDYHDPAVRASERAKQAMARGDWEIAIMHWKEARRLKPESEEIEHGLRNAMSRSLRASEERQADELSRRQRLYQLSRGGARKAKPSLSKVDRVLDKFGFLIRRDREHLWIENVRSNSSAYHAGLVGGEKLVSVWDVRVSYRSVEDAAGLILNSDSGELQISVEWLFEFSAWDDPLRERTGSEVDATWDMVERGIEVSQVKPDGIAEAAGVRKGDLLVEIMGQPTRYMEFKRFKSILDRTPLSELTVKVQRDISIF